MAGDDTVEIKAKIPAELHARFARALPMYGAIPWLVRTAMEETCEVLEEQPALRDSVAEAIKRGIRR